MARLFDNILKDMDIAEEEEIYFGDGKAKARMLRKEMTDDDINHYAKVYGFDSDDYTMAEKRLLAINRINYWTHS